MKKRKQVKRGLAALLAALLIVPAGPVMAQAPPGEAEVSVDAGILGTGDGLGEEKGFREGAEEVPGKPGDVSEKPEEVSEKAGENFGKAEGVSEKSGEAWEKSDDGLGKAGKAGKASEKVKDPSEEPGETSEKSEEVSKKVEESSEKAEDSLGESEDVSETSGETSKEGENVPEESEDFSGKTDAMTGSAGSEKLPEEEQKIPEKEGASENEGISEGKEVPGKEGISDGEENSDKEISRNEGISGGKADSGKEVSEKKDGAIKETEAEDEDEILDEDLLVDDVYMATPANAVKAAKAPREEAEDEVSFNTGNHVYHIVSREDFFDYELGDGYFEEDGSYTINIPEPNPFFPYEVQFTYEGKVTEEWFMTPDDCVEIGGHEFSVSAYFDGTVMTQMSLGVGGDTVVVYPEKKEFTDGDGAEAASLLPLEKRYLTVDLSAYTPVELTMVSLDGIFKGGDALKDTDKVRWDRRHEDNWDLDYNADDEIDEYDTIVFSSGDKINFNLWQNIYRTPISFWQVIVGDDDQLAADNICYLLKIQMTPSSDWLTAAMYKQNGASQRTEVTLLTDSEVKNGGTSFSNGRGRGYISLSVMADQLQKNEPVYVGLDINPSVYAHTMYDHLKAYEGTHLSVEEAMASRDVTEIFVEDMTQPNAGYMINANRYTNITIVVFNAQGEVTGCLPLRISIDWIDNEEEGYIHAFELRSENHFYYRSSSVFQEERKGKEYRATYELYKDDSADGVCYLGLQYSNKKEYSSISIIFTRRKVTAAYVGRYSSISEAEKKGAHNISNELFSLSGYGANYKDGVDFTIFVGEDSNRYQEVHHCHIKVEEGNKIAPSSLNFMSEVEFTGLKDAQGNDIDSYVVQEWDSYKSLYNYPMILVNEDVDLSKLAPTFELSDGAVLYSSGSSSPERSGESIHDFSQGIVQYTASAENGKSSTNYWLRVIKVGGAEEGKLYINSLEGKESHTKVEDGIIYSDREILLSDTYDYTHDILLMNTGKGDIPAISAELQSDQLELDDYWTLKGDYPLKGVNAEEMPSPLELNRLSNKAKLRFKAKEGVAEGTEITGTLTIKSSGKTLMVLALTGLVGGPGITTEQIPQPVKYVPYGTMIQNNNKYYWNNVTYKIVDGRLPDGMELKPNGELYGVPKESGEFTFTVGTENSYSSFSSVEKTFTLVVAENTDANVDDSTDAGYELTQRVQNMPIDAAYDQMVVSQGPYDEFVDVFLDGEKLTEGTDYTSESGSTRITIRSETLKKSDTPGKHTIGIEFRTKKDKTLKRAAQNYEVTQRRQSSSKRSGGGGGGSTAPAFTRDAKKGYIDPQKGIITGEGEGYSHWLQDENGWKLLYADGTLAMGAMVQQSDGSTVEQVLWELINGFWYAFGANGYLKSGWVYDYQLESWYVVSADTGMQSGWHEDAQDGYTYYMEPATGKLAAGWRQINEKWYYFNEFSSAPTWEYDGQTGTWRYNRQSKNKPYASMYCDEKTPDGYFVGSDGVWDGNGQ